MACLEPEMLLQDGKEAPRLSPSRLPRDAAAVCEGGGDGGILSFNNKNDCYYYF